MKKILFFIPLLIALSGFISASAFAATRACAPTIISSPITAPDGSWAQYVGSMSGPGGFGPGCLLTASSSTIVPSIRIVGHVGTAAGGVSITANALYGGQSFNLQNYTINGIPTANSTTSHAAAIGSTYVIQGSYWYQNITYTVAATLAFTGAAGNQIVTISNATMTASIPTITSISPATGLPAGGTAITITGTNFTGATSVTIGGVAATSRVVVNATTITAVTPAGTAGAKDVVVTTTSNGSATGTGLFTYIPPPTITSISPASGLPAGGTAITIAGTNFTGATSVTIGGVAATGVTLGRSNNRITAVTPAGTTGAKDVVVTTPSGSATGTGLFTYAPTSTVTAISPATGPLAGGTAVTITGTNFTGATSVTIGGVTATSRVVVNATTITAVTSAGTAAGTQDVVVTTPSGSGTGTGLFTYIGPSITAISPATGPLAGGTAVTITGTNFTGATSVTIGGVTATSRVVVNATTITAVTPAGTAGAKDVVVTTPSGSATGTGLFTYAPTSTVTAISPATGPFAGGTAVTITGTNFIGATSVTIGGVAATSRVVVNATTITAVTSAATVAGAKDVVVTTPGGVGTGIGLFTYTPRPDPTQDPSVIAQMTAQVMATQQAMNTQMMNLSSHMQQLRSNFNVRSVQNDISLKMPSHIQQSLALMNEFVSALHSPESYLVVSNDPNFAAPNNTMIDNQASQGGVGLWFGGSLNFGAINTGVSDNKFTSSGLTIGLDYLLRDDLIVGATVGFGWDSTDIDAQGTNTKARSPSASVYASYKYAENTFIDGWFGYGLTTLTNQRWVPAASLLVSGDRKATSYFGSLAATGSLKASGIKLEPYIRGDFVHSKLNAYSETGNTVLSLSYNAINFNATSLSAGFVVSYDIPTSIGIFTPQAGGQYMSTKNSSATQDMYYTDAASTVYSLGIVGIPTSIVSTQIGLLYKNSQGITGDVGFEFSQGDSLYISRRFNMNVNIPF